MKLVPMSLFSFFCSIRRRHTIYWRDWSSDVCSSDLSVSKKKPFFLMVSENAVHVPMQGPNDPPLRTDSTCPYRNDENMTDTEYRRVYQDMVRSMDDGVGQIVSTLREQGVLDNTVIIYISDNGGEKIAAEKYPGNNGYFRGAKGGPYEGGCRVPAIFYYPKEWGHRKSSEAMHCMDLIPTFLRS